MNLKAFSKNLFDKYFPYIVILIFFGLSIILILRHELWEDEVLVWQKVAYTNSFRDYLSNMRDSSGSPYLWYLIIYFISKYVTGNIESIKIIHLAISTATAYLVLKYSPFNKILRILIIFSYLFFYEYSTISRSYALGILLIIIFCILYENRLNNILLISIILFLTGQTNIFSFILSCVLFVYFLSDIFLEREKIKAKYMIFVPFSMLVLGVLAIWFQLGSQILGVREFGSELNAVFGWGFNDIKTSVIDASKGITSAFLQVPQNRLDFWNTNIFLGFLSKFRNLYTVLLSSVLFFIPLLFIKRKYVPLYICGAIGIISVPFFLYIGSIRHWGHIFILLIACIWLSIAKEEDDYLFKIRDHFIGKIRNIFLITILFLSVIGSSIAFYYDYRYPFSSAKDTAEYIENNLNKDDLKIIGYRPAEVSLISAFLDEPFYYNASKKFQKYIYAKDRLEWIDINIVFKEAYSFILKDDNVLLIISRNIGVPEGLPEYYQFREIDTGLPSAIVSKENYSLYIFDKKTFYEPYELFLSTDYKNFLDYWKPLAQCRLLKDPDYPDKIIIKTEGDDPSFESNFNIETDGLIIINCKLNSQVKGIFTVYYAKTNEKYSQNRSVEYPIEEGLNNIITLIQNGSSVEKIRIDPIDQNKDCIINEIKMYHMADNE